MHAKIMNRLNQPVDRLPGAAVGKKKLRVKQELVHIDGRGNRNVITSYECHKGKSYDFYFKRNGLFVYIYEWLLCLLFTY